MGVGEAREEVMATETKTFADDIEEAADGEAIEAIVIGRLHYDWTAWERRNIPEELREVPITWAQARPLLAYQYDRSFGGADCHAIFAWTTSRVIWVHEYDGATSIAWAPRNPVECKPKHSGLE